jgi:hypothetical protein
MKRLLARGVSVALLGFAMSSPSFADGKAAGHCRDIEGPFTSVLVPPPQCTSPVGLCTLGDLQGDLEATYEATFLTMVPAGDPDHPGRLHYTGISVITLKHGNGNQTMTSDDDGFLDPDPAAPLAYFATTVHVIRGTHGLKHASGTLVASGVLNFITGAAEGSYVGDLCKNE